MNYGYNTTQVQGSVSNNNTGNDTGEGNKGNIPYYGHTGGDDSGSGGGDDRKNNNRLPREPEDKLTNYYSMLLYLMDLFSTIHLNLSNLLPRMQYNLRSLEGRNTFPSSYQNQELEIEIFETTLNNLRIFDRELSMFPNNEHMENLRENIAYIISEIELFLQHGSYINLENRRIINFSANIRTREEIIAFLQNCINSVIRLMGNLDRNLLLGNKRNN
jgi:hypothetical protein